MAESLLLPVVRAAAGKASDALVQSVTGMWGVDGDRARLERQLLAVQCKLVDAEVKSGTNPAVKRWMKDLRAVAYEADDVLDDFQYEALRREAQIGNSTFRKVISYFTNHSPLLFRLTMSWKLSSVLQKINELVMEMNTFGLENRPEAPQVPYRQTHAALDESVEIFGRDNDKAKVVELLRDQQDEKKVQVLPIFGMGGLGKTTLAKMVYNDSSVQQHFQLRMWHCVSDNFEAIALVKSVIELATKDRCNLPDTIELLRGKLHEVIGQKRFLLILDDVWNEEDKKWEDELKPLLCSVGGPGSVIVVTCRNQQVASIMGTLPPHELACLSEDDSWELFSKKAFSKGVEEQAELVTIGKRIVKKCKGLPLSLKTMGGLMSSKQQVKEWEAIEESNIGDNVRGKDEILPILKLSYNHLSSEMKQCFAFCAVFPKDYEMDKDILIQLWMANGFIQEEVTMDLAQKGEFIFHDLVWRSFLQDVKKREEHFLVSGKAYELVCCKMHDLMHDLAKRVTDECATIEELIEQKVPMKDVRHMEISNARLEQNSDVSKGKASLRTLLAATSHKDLKKLGLVSLRALSYHSPIINSQVIIAKHLRYLDLTRSDIVRLPDSVCMLYNLQSLRLNGCWKLQQLPKDMGSMRKLIHLYLVGCVSLRQMPRNISRLKNLHTLTMFIVDTEAGRGIEELKDLRHLGNRLELYDLRKIKSGSNAKEANLHQKQNLSELFLFWGPTGSDKPEDEVSNEEQVLESLAPHSKLRVLKVAGYSGQQIAQWMRQPRMFQCLKKLIISNCPRCKDLPIVWLSVSLEYLSLDNMGSLTTLCKSIEVEGEGYSTPLHFFPKLKIMLLDELQSLQIWAENSAGEPDSLVVFPVLEVLTMNNCPKLVSVPESPVLKELKITGCRSLAINSLAHLTTLSELEYDGGRFGSTSMPLGSWPFPSLLKLKVWSLANMMVMPLEDQQSQRPLETLRNLHLSGPNCFGTGLFKRFSFVEELEIRDCDELVRWPIEELRCLVRLRSLSISYCNNLEGKGSSSEEALLLPQLERLSIIGCRSLLEIPKLPASLEQLDVQFCKQLVALPPNLGDPAKLKDLSVRFCSGLKALPDGMDGLTSLERLDIRYCEGIEKFPEGLLHRLPALKSLIMISCSGLKVLPDGMDGLTSLEELWIQYCPGIEKFPEGLLQRLPALKSLRIISCSGLKALPDGMDGLTSLEELEIRDCPGIEKFPEGLLQRLPALKSLWIWGCPELGRRCREGGEYFQLLSSIPRTTIDAPESSMKKFVKRVLPSCSDSILSFYCYC